MAFAGDSIYWVEVEKVVPNPFQPRREFNESKLQELAESIRMYGVLQPLTVTRQEVQNADGTFFTQYELIAGERRLRASRLAGTAQVPVIIREGEDSEQEKLELAIIENLQREDLNAIDRAMAFQQLSEQFKLNHAEVGRKVGRSREYVANSIRLLQLPEHMRLALQRGDLGEGHARTLLMLNDRPEEQETIFREVLLKKMSVRELERIARKIATDKVRKPQLSDIDQHLIDIEKEFTETLGTRVQIQKTEFGGKLTIDYFSEDDLAVLLKRVSDEQSGSASAPIMQSAPAAAPVVSAPVVHTQSVPEAPIVSAPSAHVVPDAYTAPQVATAQSTVSSFETAAMQAPAADPGLLEKLAAHTPLSFGQDVPPTPQPEPQPVPAPVVEQQPVAPIPPAPTPEPAYAPAPIPEPVTPVVEEATPTQPPEDDQDIYSMRNFTV